MMEKIIKPTSEKDVIKQLDNKPVVEKSDLASLKTMKLVVEERLKKDEKLLGVSMYQKLSNGEKQYLDPTQVVINYVDVKPKISEDGVFKLSNTEMSEDEFFMLLGTNKYNALPAIIWDTLQQHGFVISKKEKSRVKEVFSGEIFTCEGITYAIKRIENAVDKSNLENGYNIYTISHI